MSDNAEIVRGIYTAMNAHDIDAMTSMMREDILDHEMAGELPPGRAGVQQWFGTLFEAFPDMTTTVEDVICQGDRCACRVRMHGTHQAEFLGIPATRNPVDIEVIDIMRIEDGRVAEHWGLSDDVRMMRQLGAAMA